MTRARRGPAVVAGVGAVGLLAAVAWLAWPLPAAVLASSGAGSITLLDRSGQPLRSALGGEADRRWVAIADVDPDVLRAFIAVEDDRFFRHPGVDLHAVARAARDNWRAGRTVSGASTISMQLARLLVPLPRTWAGKLRQAAWALRLERHLAKQAILEQYLNRVPLGQGTVGIGAAADLYFDTGADALSVGQAALLAALARAPSRDNPLIAPDRARVRRAIALGRMRRTGVLAAADSAAADAEPIVTARRARFEAPHFTSRFLLWQEASLPARSRVRTSLDLALQHDVEGEVRHTVAQLADRGGRHAAAVVLDNATGEILAWVGSPDFWDPEVGQVDMVVSPRQPGSALKPFLYALAFDAGYTPASVLPDIPHTYVTPAGPYQPRNYDRRFHGPVRIREALASSHNVPAVELVERLGVGPLLAVLHRAGFTSLDRPPEYYGLGLALGNGDVTLLELANGYRALANAGTWSAFALTPATSPDTGDRVVSPLAAALVLDILSDPVARVPGFGEQTPFALPFPLAAKTGTSRNFTDNWAVGVTGGFTVAVWVGDFTGRAMEQVSGVTGAGPLLQRVVLRTAARFPPGLLPDPGTAGASRVRICRLSGGLATSHCPDMPEWLPAGRSPDSCGWHRPSGTVLPTEYATWAAADPSMRAALATAGPATRPTLRIVSPADGDRYSVPPGVDARYATVALRAVGSDGGRHVRWFVDGRPIAGTRWRLQPGEHHIRAETTAGASDEVVVVVE